MSQIGTIETNTIEPDIVFTSSDDSDDEHITVSALLVGNMSVYHEQESNLGRPHGRVESRKDDPLYKIEVSCNKCIINCLMQEEKFAADRTMKFTQAAFDEAVRSLDLKTHFKSRLVRNTNLHTLDLSTWDSSQSYLFSSLLAIYGCLRSLGIRTVPLSFKKSQPNISAIVERASSSPESQLGYLCCLDNNWIVLRKIGTQWVRLDPRLSGPQLLNDLYLSLFVSQFLEEDRMIFVLDGLRELSCPPNPTAPVATEEGAAAISPEHVAQQLQELGLAEDTLGKLPGGDKLIHDKQALVALLSALTDMTASFNTNSNVSKPVAKKEDETLCCVCLETAATHVVVPCGHLCLCETCEGSYRSTFSLVCPVCQTTAKEIIKLYR